MLSIFRTRMLAAVLFVPLFGSACIVWFLLFEPNNKDEPSTFKRPRNVTVTTLVPVPTGVYYQADLKELSTWGPSTYTPKKYFFTHGVLPPGMSLSQTGILHGTASSNDSHPEHYEFSVRAIETSWFSPVERWRLSEASRFWFRVSVELPG